jgi:hypothetical protein
MPTIDEEIARKLQEAAESGELRTAASYGKPLAGMEGWEQTPEGLRMAFKILKDAGFAPPEVALFHQRAQLRTRVNEESDPERRIALQRELAALEQKLSLRLEALRIKGAL